MNKLFISAICLVIVASTVLVCQYGVDLSKGVSNAAVNDFKDYEKMKSSYTTIVYDDEYVDVFDEYDTASLVIKGKFNGVFENSFDYSTQEVVVEKVLKGSADDIVGKTIKINSLAHFDIQEKNLTFNFFSTLMKKDNDYLIFLNKSGDTYNCVFGLSYFNYKSVKNVFASEFLSKKEYESIKKDEEFDSMDMKYSLMESGEFICLDKDTEDKIYKYKEKLFEKYGEKIIDEK